MDKQKHKLYMAQILSLIFKDKDLCNVMGFKGGTALMFFHKLPRFSTDLDFNLLDTNKLDIVYANNEKEILHHYPAYLIILCAPAGTETYCARSSKPVHGHSRRLRADDAWCYRTLQPDSGLP